MALRTAAAARTIARRFATAAEAAKDVPAKGPRLPPGNDPAAYHSIEHAAKDTDRWKLISLVFGLPVLGFGILKVSKPHDHVDPPVEYPYLRMATRSPRFPWGEDDLLGTSYERHAKDHGDGHH